MPQIDPEVEEKLHGHILVVDDQPIIQAQVGAILRKIGLTYDAVSNGQEALEKLEAGKYDSILLDIIMPVMDGVEVLKQIKANPHLWALPVIILSSVQEAEMVRECIRLGADDFIHKPVDPLFLKARLDQSLTRKFLVDRVHETVHDIQHQNADLKQLNDLKRQFLEIAAHDLKNPMGQILLLTDRLMMADEDQTRTGVRPRLAGEIQGTVKHMMGIIQGLLDSAAFESGKLSIRKVPTDVNALARQVVEKNRAYAQTKGILLEWRPVSEDPIMSFVDPVRITEVFENLVGNAIKFSPPRMRVTVRMGLHEPTSTIRFAVKDRGPGLTPDDHKRVFGNYERLSARPTGGETSTGLGLYIVKQMAEAHGGKAWVESEAGKGALFGVDLPL